MNLLYKSTLSTPWSKTRGIDIRLSGSIELAGVSVEALKVDTERPFLPRFKNWGLAPSNVSKGFTLIEISVSLVILSIALLALASLMTMTMKNNSSGNRLTEAVTFAQDKLEDLRVRPWNYITTDKDTSSTGSTGISYVRDWIVQPNADDSLKTVNITVTWNDGTDHSISILSAITK